MDSHSFHAGQNHERALFVNEQGSHSPSPVHEPYQDSPMRDITSPPPGYTSPEPQDSPLPSSPTRALYRSSFDHNSRHSRENSRGAYVADVPPPPPPHLSSPTKSIRRKSVTNDSVSPVSTRSENFDQQQVHLPDHVSQGVFQQRGSMDTTRSTQLPGLQPGYRPEQSYGPNSFHRPTSRLPEQNSYSSNIALAGAAATPGSITPASTPDLRSSRYSGRSIPLEDYSMHPHSRTSAYYDDSPYHDSSQKINATVSDASINPCDIADDGDDGFIPDPKRKTVMATGQPHGKGTSSPDIAVGTTSGTLGSFFGRTTKDRSGSGSYNHVDGAGEKGTWLKEQKRGRKNRKWMGIGIGALIVVAIIAGIVGGVLGTRGSAANTGSDINNANDDTAHNGDLDINSAEIKALMNNPNLHKVFPGMDYTPWGVQYPLCLTYPPSQNNVTRDMAVLSQLTNTVRLYGTDCNQTEMVLHAIDRLQLTNMKVWLGVWIDTNATTTNRQIAQMYKILDEVKDKSIFKGAIIGNEALYRAGEDKAQSKQELITLLTDTKSNFTSLGYNLPVATSDLGDNWDGDLVTVSDYVMSNIHPFFAGVSSDVAAAWTWNFWQTHDVVLTATNNVKQIISETGWPSGGGTDCGGTTGACATGQSGAVASIDNMNTFMADWVCQALANGTEYFWFEAFDEPWKVQYNTPGMAWEDKWGLMDSARNLKSGLKIPNCGGQTVSS